MTSLLVALAPTKNGKRISVFQFSYEVGTSLLPIIAMVWFVHRSVFGH